MMAADKMNASFILSAVRQLDNLFKLQNIIFQLAIFLSSVTH